MKSFIVGLLQVIIPIGSGYLMYEWIKADFSVRITFAVLICLAIAKFINTASERNKLYAELDLHRALIDRQGDRIRSLETDIEIFNMKTDFDDDDDNNV